MSEDEAAGSDKMRRRRMSVGIGMLALLGLLGVAMWPGSKKGVAAGDPEENGGKTDSGQTNPVLPLEHSESTIPAVVFTPPVHEEPVMTPTSDPGGSPSETEQDLLAEKPLIRPQVDEPARHLEDSIGDDVPPPPPPVPGLDEKTGSLVPRVRNRGAVQHLAMAREITDLGDMSGVLRNLRLADSLEPNHPEILYELAKAYLAIGHDTKGGHYLRQVSSMGPETAGEFAVLATAKLKAGLIPKDEPDIVARPLRLGEILLREEEMESGQRVHLTVSIRSAGGAIDVNGVHIYTYFFDLVDNHKVERTTTDRPLEQWPTAPVDWRDLGGEELLRITYNNPGQSAEERATFGSRVFYGYVIKIYYLDRLQDIVAFPRILAEKSSGMERPQTKLGNNPLFDFGDE